MTIQTVSGQEVPAAVEGNDVVWCLQEATEYRVCTRVGGLRGARLDALPLDRIDAHTVRLYVGHWTSAARPLVVEFDGGTIERTIRVIPQEEKLDEPSWLGMLTDLERWLPGISVGPSGGTSGGLSADGTASAGFCAIALLPLVPALLRALRDIAAAPRERSVEFVEHVPLRGIRRADPSALAWLTRHPSAAMAVDAWRSLERPGPEPRLPRVATTEDIDHPVNRYVVWAVRRASRTLERLAERLATVSRRPGIVQDTRRWCRARSRAAELAASELRAFVRRSVLARIPPAPPTGTALLALQDEPMYSRFHRLARPFTNPRYAADASDDSAPARPSYELFELWTFLALVRGLEAARPRWTVQWHHTTNCDFAGGMGNGSWVELHGEGEHIEAHFNRTFRSYLNKKVEEPYSISGERRPDIVVGHVRRDGSRRWMFFDAKYRVARRALAESFESVHIYRDALRWPEMGGECEAGFLLVPAIHSDASTWFSEEFRREYRCGCLRLRPGVEEDDISQLVGVTAEQLG